MKILSEKRLAEIEDIFDHCLSDDPDWTSIRELLESHKQANKILQEIQLVNAHDPTQYVQRVRGILIRENV